MYFISHTSNRFSFLFYKAEFSLLNKHKTLTKQYTRSTYEQENAPCKESLCFMFIYPHFSLN